MEMELLKKHERGGATYINKALRAKLTVSKRMFAGDAPASIVFEADGIREATEADLKRAQRTVTRLANAENLPERIERTKKKLERLNAALAQQGAKSETVSA